MTGLEPIVLEGGVVMPATGFGTYALIGDEGEAAIRSAIEVGYRLLDTARSYGNEPEVGRAIRSTGIAREELFVTTKLRGADHGDGVERGITASLKALGVDYLDLFLIHWPLPRLEQYVRTWEAMVGLRERGLVRAIGVSNFTPRQLDRIARASGITPAVHQMEMHPFWRQDELRSLHRERGIATQSWSPLAVSRNLVDDPVVRAIADEHGVEPAQVILRWHVQKGSCPIPKASRREKQETNIDLAGFALTSGQVAQLDAFPQSRLWGGDPMTHEEF